MNNIDETTTGQQQEIWLEITTNPNYEISNLGRARQNKTQIMKPTHNGGIRQYQFIRLDDKKHYIHQLVLTHFVGEKPEGFECDHIDKDRTNNNLTNLRYLSIIENRGRKGEAHCQRKLSEAKVKFIREVLAKGEMTRKRLAEIFEVHINTIKAANNGRSWSHI